MLSRELNAYLTEVEPGKPMHELLRRYWLPAGLAREVAEPGCDPVRTQMLGLDFVIFRDRSGKLGMLDEYCPHRRASLTLARVEADGLRCIYHGWKFAPDGALLEMPNVAECRNPERFRQAAYPVREAGGLIWAYLGPPDLEPPFPDFEFFSAPYVRIDNPIFEANFVQVLEGLIDSSHLGFLHSDVHSRGITDATGQKPMVGSVPDQFVGARSPRIEVRDTDWGFRYAALRDMDTDASVQARVTAYIHPVFCQTAADDTMQIAVPINSHRTVFYHLFWDREGAAPRADMVADMLGFGAERTDPHGLSSASRDHPNAPSRANGYGQDRAAMRRGECFSGLRSVIVEDMAMTNSMGTITDRSREHLVETDAAVVRLRQLLIENAKAVEAGQPARGQGAPKLATSGEGTLRDGQSWESLFPEWRIPERV